MLEVLEDVESLKHLDDSKKKTVRFYQFFVLANLVQNKLYG
jgi:hypothetical protein